MNTQDRRTPVQIVRECRELVLKYYDGDQASADAWFGVPNPMLKGYKPETLIKSKQHCKLLRSIRAWLGLE